MNKSPLVSIVICSYNGSAKLSECLGALIPQIGDQAEVIVVDSASDENNRAEMAKLVTLHSAVQLIRVDQPGARSPAIAACNWQPLTGWCSWTTTPFHFRTGWKSYYPRWLPRLPPKP